MSADIIQLRKNLIGFPSLKPDGEDRSEQAGAHILAIDRQLVLYALKRIALTHGEEMVGLVLADMRDQFFGGQET